MGQSVTWTVTASVSDKVQAAALAVEFWTSVGFEEHSSSYNRLIFRRNGYGTAAAWIGAIGVRSRWAPDAPMELTILTQILPAQVKYNLKFELGFGYSETKDGDLKSNTQIWIDEFIEFVNKWKSNG